MKGLLIFTGYCGVSVMAIMLIARIFFYSLTAKVDPLIAVKPDLRKLFRYFDGKSKAKNNFGVNS